MGKAVARLLLSVLALASCARGNETCSTLTTCPSGGHQFCKSGPVCSYHLTDGTTINCASCGDCVAAIDLVERWCDPSQPRPDLAPPPDFAGRDFAEELPDLAPPPPLTIPKTGSYTGTKFDRMLTDPSMCPDASLEPNDQRNPLSFLPYPDQPTAKIVKMAICPKGAGDTDWFKIELTQSLYMTAQVFYDVSYGDLDVAIVNAQGQIIAADGSAVTDGCAASSVGPGTVYVVVAGANNVDTNLYELLIKTFAAPHACP